MQFAKIILGVALTVTACCVAAQTPPGTSAPPQRLQALEVAPAVAAVGIQRTITITGTWPNSCVPTNATIERPPSDLSRAVFLRVVALADSDQFCASVFTSYKIEVPYTPTQVGVDNVFVLINSVSTSGPLLASREARVVVTAAVTPAPNPPPPTTTVIKPRSADDVSGVWYDATTEGSGLTITHSYRGSDAVFGTWFLYDRDGAPRWYTLQETVWVSDSAIEGKLYQSRSLGCTNIFSGANACPTEALLPPTQIGTFRITFKNLRLTEQQNGVTRTAPTGVIEALAASGSVLFRSQISRISL